MAGQSGNEDVSIENAHSVGDFQVLLRAGREANEALRNELETYTRNTEQQLAQLRVDLRLATIATAQAQAGGGQGSESREIRMELIDMKSMSPATFSGAKGEHFKA